MNHLRDRKKSQPQSIRLLTATLWMLLAMVAICGGGSLSLGWAQDLNDCALLYDSANLHDSDINFQKICRFYGLRCREIDLQSIELSDSLLRDANGQALAGIAVNMQTLEQTEPLLLDSLELNLLKGSVEDGAHLLISGFTSSGAYDFKATHMLTEGRVVGCWPSFCNLNWIIADLQPEITREFSGQTIPFQDGENANSPIVTGSASILVSSLDRDAPQTEYPVFVALPLGSGTVFVDGCRQTANLTQVQMCDLYYCYDFFHQIVPTMMFVRFAGDQECWHNEHNYANLIIDDPSLSNMQQGHLNFYDVLQEMEAHDFGITIGFEPKDFQSSAAEVVQLFLDHPHRYFIVQHGNNHDGFEFFAYDSAGSLTVCLERGWCNFPPRPLHQHEADIVEGATRMAEFTRLTGLPHGQVMIFPYGISPEATLALLKSYNFLATVNGLSVPIGEQRGQNDDFHMRPTDMNYANFASSSRRHWLDDKLYLYDLFIDKPVLIYEHHGFFESGPDAFNEAADAINAVMDSVEWLGLGDIFRRLHLQKKNDDGTISIRMYTNDLILSNETSSAHQYRILKEETLNVPLVALTIDGEPASYSLVGDTLRTEVTILPGTSAEIAISYASGDKDFAISPGDIQFDSQVSDTLTATVHNLGLEGGPVTVQLFDGHPDSGGTSLDLSVIERIEPNTSHVIKRSLGDIISGAHQVYIVLDHHNIVHETNEQNNYAKVDVFVPDELTIDDFEYDDSPLNHGWAIDSGTGELAVVYDSTLNSRVLEASTQESTDFRIHHTAYDTPKRLLSLKMQAAEFFILYVRVQTTAGEYYLQYTPDTGVDTVGGSYVYFHLGETYRDSQWHAIQRDLAADVAAHLDAELSWVKHLVLRGAYKLDDLALSQPGTGVADDPKPTNQAPRCFSLYGNHPNPFNGETVLSYFLSKERFAELSIYNVAGQRVSTLVKSKQPPGLHTLTWTGRSDSGEPVASGIYFAVLRVGDKLETTKMVLLR